MKVAWQILPDPDETHDVFQEAFLRYHTTLQRGEEIYHAKAWLCRTASNIACQRLRQKRREVLLEEEIADIDNSKDIENYLLLDRVRQLVAELPERQRKVVTLRQFAGLSFAEIAAQLQCSEEAVRANQYKALKTIRAWIGDSWRE